MSLLGNILKIAVGTALVYFSGGTAAFFGGTSALFGSATLGMMAATAGIGLQLTTAMSALGIGPKQPKYEDPGARLRLTADPDAPRWVCYGTAKTGGSLLYRETLGADNDDLYMVIAVAGHEIDSFEGFTWGGKAISFTGNNAVGTLNNFMYKYDHLGTDGQAADTVLDAASTKWTANHKLGGIAYVVLKLVYDVDKHPNGLQNPGFTIKGRKLYDPRLDSTNGGSGTHRLADPSTWEWSDNPALALADYLRGIYVANSATTAYDGTRIAGMGVATDRIDYDAIISAADICDESVALGGGGSETRYTLNGFIDPTGGHKQNIERMAQAMAGAVVFQGGQWRIYAGKTRLPSESRTAEQVIGGLEFKAKAGWDGRVNSVRGQWIDPSSGYKPRDIPPLVNSTYKTEDGDQEIWADIDLPFTTSGTMAQRLAKIYLNRARRQRMIQATFMPVAIRDQVMDVVSFTHDTFNLSAERFVVADWALRAQADANGNIGLVVQETLIEEPSDLYDWNEATEEQAIPDQDTVNRADRVKPDLGDLSGTADFASQVGGPEKPVDNATNNPITYGSGAPTGGSYDDIYIDLTNEDLWFNEGGTWGNRQTNRAEGHKYLSGESVEALKPLEAGATVDTRYGTGNLLGLDSHPTYEQAGLLAPAKHFVGTEVQKGTLADFGLAVGDVLTVSADIEVVATVPHFGVFIAFYSVAGSYMGAASSISAFAYTATGSFSRYSGTGAVPAGAVFFKVYTSTDGSGTGFTYTAVRRVMLHRGAVALPYEAASNKTMSGNLLGSDATQERETVGTGYNYEGWSIAGTINTSKNLLTLGLQGGDLFHFGYEFKTVGSVSPYAWIRFYDSAGAVIADYANYRAVTDAPWQYLNMLAHVPAGAAYVAVRATYSGAVPTSLMVRHAVVNTGLHPLPFSEGKFNLLDNVGDAIMLGVGHTLGGRTQHYNNLGRLDTVHGMPANTIAGPSSAVNVAPISAADAGSTATITIGAHTRQFDSGAVSYNAGSIMGRSFSTTYYIYCDDATLAGGAVTYVATTDILDIAKVAARVYVGRVYTPANDGTTTYQEPDSGGGELP